MKNKVLTKDPLSWFLLLWVAMATVGSLLGGIGQSTATYGGGIYFLAISSSPSANPATANPTASPLTELHGNFFAKPTPTLPSTLIFLLLVALYSFLLWCGLSGRVPSRLSWLYFAFQGPFVLAMQWIVKEPNLALNFYLGLTLCAVLMLKRVIPVLLVGISYLLLFFVALSINFPDGIPIGTNLTALWLSFWSFSELTTLVFFILGYLILYVQQSRAQRELEQAHLELQGAHSRLAASSRQIETLTLLTERQRIARELHDTLAQGMAGMIMQLEVTSAQMRRKNYPQAQQVLNQALSYARTTLQEARQAITDLRSRTPHVDQLVESVQEEITHFLQTTGIVCHTSLSDLIYTPACACEHALRVIGEGLNNVTHHARATEVKVEARVIESWLSITVQDNGQGFDPDNHAPNRGRYGLLGLQERANLVGGTLEVSSSDGKGTRLEFRIPLADAGNPVLPPGWEPYPSLSVEEQSYV